MSTIYQPQIDSALQLIKSKGRAVVFKRATGGGVDPVTQVDTTTYTQYNAFGVTLPVGLQGKKSSDIPEDLRNRKATKVICAASGLAITPQAGEIIVIDGVEWDIRSVDTVAPDGTPIIHTIIALL